MSKVAKPRLWCLSQLEFYVAFISVASAMIYLASQSNHWRHLCRSYRSCDHFLRPQDTADDQWREFRSGLPLLGAVMLAHAAASRSIRALVTKPHLLAQARLALSLTLSAVLLFVLHGADALIPVALASLSYFIGNATAGSASAPWATWSCGLGLLYLKEFHGKSMRWGLGGLWSGMQPWTITFNLVVLRLISFNMDIHWSAQGGNSNSSGSSSKPSSPRPSAPSATAYWTFLVYIFYAPCYLAGPVMCYKDFRANLQRPDSSRQSSAASLIPYASRLAFSIVLMEVAMRYYPVFALARSGVFRLLAPGSLCIFVYGLLQTMWVKFLVIWRFARLWCLLDGVNPPENMTRCVSNSQKLSDFWRGWHCSFNKWLIRYIYVPLGGSKSQHWNIFVVFGFVALWHDWQPKLFVWGLMNGLVFACERSICAWYHSSEALSGLRSHLAWNRLISTLAAVACQFLLITANVVGYAVGIEGTGAAMSIVGKAGAGWAAAGTFMTLAGGVLLMFDLEERRAIAAQ
ncbi:unnamed protein product [Chrysoparadoxa australica]